MQLNYIDFIVIVLYLFINIAIGFVLRKKATQSVDDFFVSGRSVPWWLAGTSMVATTFAADTPLVVTGLVAKNGIAGNWIWWSFLFSGILTVFFFAKLWRRSEVLTDVEFVELRYAGKAASFLRYFRAIYLAIPVNLIIMGWVNLAMVKILSMVLGIGKFEALIITFGIMFITTFISTLSGLWGVLWTDLFQFALIMTMVILLAVFSVNNEGGMQVIVEKLKMIEQNSNYQKDYLSFLPDLNSIWMPFIAFFVYIAINWWASWYPGSEPGGGGYIAQRIFSAKNEKHSILATLWFNVAHYVLRPWPWIIVALVAVIRFHSADWFLKDPESGYIKVMIQDLPSYFRGVMLAGFLAAYMSTIATQLNWGASYIINDVFKKIHRNKSNKTYVTISQLVTVLLMIFSCIVTYYLDSIAGAWKLLMSIGAGTGLVYILRWYWWRINAWSEISAMLAAFSSSILLQFVFGFNENNPKDFAYMILISVTFTTFVWIIVTYLTKPEDENVLINFFKKVKPDATFWKPILEKCPDVIPNYDIKENSLFFILSLIFIYSLLFGVGNIILLNYFNGVILILLAVVIFIFLYIKLIKFYASN
jgi:Na+/proline symporter